MLLPGGRTHPRQRVPPPPRARAGRDALPAGSRKDLLIGQPAEGTAGLLPGSGFHARLEESPDVAGPLSNPAGDPDAEGGAPRRDAGLDLEVEVADHPRLPLGGAPVHHSVHELETLRFVECLVSP